MDPTNYYQQQMMAQALMGTPMQPGTMPSGQMPTTPWGQMAMSGQPTTPGGMLGTSPWTPFDPNAPAGPIPPTMDPMSGTGMMTNPQQPNSSQLTQPMASYKQFELAGQNEGERADSDGGSGR